MPERRPARDVTKARLLATAEEMFFNRGYAATSVEAISAEAGFTTGAIYSNFGGKADLFLAVLEKVTAADLAAVREVLATATTDEQRLSVFATSVSADPTRFRARVAATLEFMSAVRDDKALQSRVLAAQQVADEAVAEVVSVLCGSLGAEPPIAADELAVEVNALLTGLAIRSLLDPDFDVVRAMSSGVNRLLTGDHDVLQLPSIHAH